jgi:hypothetical protein
MGRLEKRNTNIKYIVNNNKVHFDSFRQGIFYYKVRVPYISQDYLGDKDTSYDVYLFPVPVEDIGTATMLAEDKAIFFMRWIRKAIEDETFILQ